MTEKRRGSKAVKIGVVVSNRMDKSVVVRVDSLAKHSFYKKYVKKRAKFMAHDEENACAVGDKVEIVESRPLSRMKRWRVRRVIEKAAVIDFGELKNGTADTTQEPAQD